MSVTIDYKPTRLTYEAFRDVDRQCFADEPMDETTFVAFLAGDFWAAWDEERFVGYCYLQRKPDFAWIRRVCVTVSYRRQGIAKRFMQGALDHCNAIGLPEMILYVQDDNLAAVRLYTAFGFGPTETTFQYSLDAAWILRQRGPRESAIEAAPIDQVPGTSLPVFPKQWADIRQMHAPPHQYVLVFVDQKGGTLGYCRLTPSFPGCFPFEIADPRKNLGAALAALHKYLLPEKDNLRLTFRDQAIAEECEREHFGLNYKLYKMVRVREATVPRTLKGNLEAT